MTKRHKIPETMKALRQYEAGADLRVEEIPLPQPGRGQVLVKMHAAPINPSDLALLRGGYMQRDYPYTPGLEGSGVVLAAGRGILPRLRLGKQVACSPDPGGDGTWGEYLLCSALRVVPLPRESSLEEGATMLVNPMTAMAFTDLCKKGKHRAMVNNAAASELGRMLIRLCRKQGIPLISIVRREEQVRELQQSGAEHVLLSTHPDFREELKQLACDLQASLFLDAVTGPESAVLLDAAPKGSTLLAYARLSGEPLEVDPKSLISENKKIRGFQLGNYLSSLPVSAKLNLIGRVKKELGSNLRSRIGERFPLEEAQLALDHYRGKRIPGKIMLKIDAD